MSSLRRSPFGRDDEKMAKIPHMFGLIGSGASELGKLVSCLAHSPSIGEWRPFLGK